MVNLSDKVSIYYTRHHGLSCEGNGTPINIKKNTIRDGGCTALYTVDTVDTADMVYTVDMVYIVDMFYTVDSVDTD